ncbi:hypothetical protein RFI_03310 [Reticulomyxa filosa]|uniref:Uncharacterized protein n=1 Tax=Reticulomyxa filosa TaxID=46433 RepID=X6P6I3_RETFI|nr:hypothetical protein RFI_03310 [Reticulomyxa filosa]|eukprot:ETO33791.1 hypothetical protein RFI_03310 [Reticulomyxa filosa]
MEQLQQSFPKIKSEMISTIWKYCSEDISEATAVLRFITEKNLRHQQQESLIRLFEDFNDRVNKQTILKIFDECKHNYANAFAKLEQISYIPKIDEKELGILREMCLQILWNLLNYPKETKYRQISDRNLYDNLKSKCFRLKINEKIMLEKMEYLLKGFGFQKGNDENWYYQKDVEIISLWAYLNFKKKKIYLSLFDLNRYKAKSSITKAVNMLKDGQWKEYEIVFDYKHRSILLLGNTDINIESLQIGNAKESSLEFDTNIQWYNDFSDVEIAHSKWACLVLDHTWHFRVMTEIDNFY